MKSKPFITLHNKSFRKKRGGGQSIWEIRRNIGFVSSDPQSKYAGNIPLRDVVLSGFHDTIGQGPKNNRAFCRSLYPIPHRQELKQEH